MTLAKTIEPVDDVRSEHPDNHYATPASLAVQFTRYLSNLRLFTDTLKRQPWITDPGYGEFPAFGFAVRAAIPHVFLHGIDIRDIKKQGYDTYYIGDYTKTDSIIGITYGNPPFSLATEILLHSRLYSTATILLLRHAFWETQDRYSLLWTRNMIPQYTFPLVRRIPWWLYNTKHKGKKSTNTTQYAFFCWFWEEPFVEYSKTIPFNWCLDSKTEAEYKALYVQE